MKNRTLTLLILLNLAVFPKLFSQNVSINSTGSLPDTSSMLDVSSTTKGFLMPRMATVQRDAIILPANGLILYNTTINAFQVNIGSSVSPVWSTLGSGTGTVTSIATGYGLSGGPITNAGTLIVDTLSLSNWYIRKKDSTGNTGFTTVYQNSLKQNQLNGTGFVKASGSSISYDNSTYLTDNQTITFAPTGDVTGTASGTTTIAPALVIGTNKVLNSMLAQMPALTIKGNNMGGLANAADLTVAQVNAILPVFTSTLNGLVPLSGGSAGKVLHGDGTWKDTAASTNQWSITGNLGTNSATNFIGTTDNNSFKIKTNNIQGFILDSLGNAAIGTSPVFAAANQEKLLVDAGASSYNVISGRGNLNSFLQLNIKNTNAGTVASSDVVATNDAGTEANGLNYVDMGVNSSGNTSTGVLGGANTGYLYSTGSDFSIGNATAAKNLLLFTGGTADANERMRIDGNGNVGIANTSPSQKLDVTGNVKFSGALMPNNLAGTAGNILTSSGAGAAPTWVAGPTIVTLGSDVINNNVTLNTIADVTGLSFSVTAGVTYRFSALIIYNAAATTTGSRWAINGPASPTLLAYKSVCTNTITSESITNASAYDLPAASNTASANTAGNICTIIGIITPSANGTVIVRFASEVASSAITAKAGSTLTWW